MEISLIVLPRQNRGKNGKIYILYHVITVSLSCVLSPVIRSRIITRRNRSSKPSCVVGVFRETSSVPRGLAGGYDRKLRALRGSNAQRIRVQNQKHNAARNARSAAVTRERRAQQKEIILKAQQKLKHVCENTENSCL